MSLFEWSTPERRRVDRILPVIPNEIYLCVFEHIAPPTGRLTPEQLRIFTHLSRVCRFFANFCLPRIFEFVDFSGAMFRDDTLTGLRGDAVYKASREATLFTQLAAKQPLALALAKTVRVCRFTDWRLDKVGSWAVRLFTTKYIIGMSHMKNIRELKFTTSFMESEHWNAIAALESLEELSFDWCKFLQGPANVKPRKRIRVKVARLRMVNCIGTCQPIAAIDARYLRTLAVDIMSLRSYPNWLSQSTLTELHISFWWSVDVTLDWFMGRLHAILMQVPKSLEALWLFVIGPLGPSREVVRRMLDDPGWKNLPLLRSLTLQVFPQNLHTTIDVFSHSFVEGFPFFTDRSFTLDDYWFTPEIESAEVRLILDDKPGPASSLRHVEVYGRILRLVDGEWSEVPSSMA